MEMMIKEGMYQDLFLSSDSKFPALIAAVGTGKTMSFLVKIYKYCEDHPGTSALVVRKEYTDLRDSTMVDFEKYFSCKIGSDKNFRMVNGSLIMFRHASEIAVLKNMNLGIAGIEQAEEFEDDNVFQFIRDRLRQQNGANVRPLCIIANAHGHNWLWNQWIQGAETNVIDLETGQIEYTNGEYHCITANTLANKDNLPEEFLKDMLAKEVEAPNHFQQYVMNSFEIMEDDDRLFTFQDLEASRRLDFQPKPGYGHRIVGYDIARYGNDKCAAYGIQQFGALHWGEFFVDEWEKKDLDYTTGRILATSNTNNANDSVIDEDGLGSGPLDFLRVGRGREDFYGYRNLKLTKEQNPDYANTRTRDAFKAKEMVVKGWLRITDEATIQELMTLRYRYTNDGRKELVSKEVMRNKYKIKSPNKADGLIMAVSKIGDVKAEQDRQYQHAQHMAQAPDGDLYRIAGVR